MATPRTHRYALSTSWSGETRDYRRYSRRHRIAFDGKAAIEGSADPALGGDADCHNPEEMMLAALSACHMLWYLHLCADAGVVVTAYEDAAEGTMVEEPHKGRFTEAVLRPSVTIAADSDAARAEALHARAHAECFIANSVNFPVRCEPTIVRAGADAA